VTTLLHILAWIALVYFLTVDAAYLAMAARTLWKARHDPEDVLYDGYDVLYRSPFTPPVSVLAVADRPASEMLALIRDLRVLDYGEYEVVLVDDGSFPETFPALYAESGLGAVPGPVRRQVSGAAVTGIYSPPSWPGLKVVRTESGERTALLNAGVNVARYPIVCVLASDAVLEKGSLLRLVRPFMDHPAETAATAGVIGAPAEDLAASLAGDAFWYRPAELSLLAGACWTVRRDMVVEVGGWRPGAADGHADLVFRLHRSLRWSRRPYRVELVDEAVVARREPGDLRSSLRRDGRRERDIVAALTGARSSTGNPRYGVFGLVWLPFSWLADVVGPFVETVGYVAVVAGAVTGLIEPSFLVLFLLAALGCRLALALAAIALRQPRLESAASAPPLGPMLGAAAVRELGYRQLANLWRLRPAVAALGAGPPRPRRAEQRPRPGAG